MQFGKSAGNFGGSVFRRPFGHDLVCGLSKFVALLPNSMQIVHNWSEKGVVQCVHILYSVGMWERCDIHGSFRVSGD